MANYPIKILIDEQGKEFVPFVNTDVVYFPDGSTLSNALDTKADKTTLAADKAELQANIDKKADITAMEQTLVDAKAYTDERVTSVYRYQGSVKNYSSLPTENLTVGDVYDTQEAQEGHEAGANYAWNGTTWDKLGMTLDYSKLQSTEAAAAQDAQIALRLKKEDVTGGENIQVTYSGDTGVKVDTKIVDNLTTEDAHASLSANQGKVLAGRVAPAGGQTNQVLAKISDSSYDMAWVKAADPNSIIGDGSIVKIIEVTYDEYLALQDAGQIDPDVEYHIADYEGDNISTIGETAIQTMIDRSIQDHVTATVPNQEQPVHAIATTETAGFMSATDKIKLGGISDNAVSRADLATDLAKIVDETTIDSKIETATKDFISETEIDGKISTATSDKINSTQAQTLIDNSTKDFVTNTEAQALVSNGVADKITTTAAQTMVNNAVADKVTATQVESILDNQQHFATVTSSGEATTGAQAPTTGKIYLYANDSYHGIYDSTYDSIIQVSADAKTFNGMANGAHTDGNGNNIAATYKMKGDFAIITIQLTLANGTATGDVSYPSGFNSSNCVVLSFMAYNHSSSGTTGGYGYIETSVGYVAGAIGHRVSLRDSVISFSINNPTDGAHDAGTATYTCKAVLMKI